MAFWLDEYGYSSLHHHILLRDVLSRVHNYRTFKKYSTPLNTPIACARLSVDRKEFYIYSPHYIVGAIPVEVFKRLQKANPVVEE